MHKLWELREKKRKLRHKDRMLNPFDGTRRRREQVHEGNIYYNRKKFKKNLKIYYDKDEESYQDPFR